MNPELENGRFSFVSNNLTVPRVDGTICCWQLKSADLRGFRFQYRKTVFTFFTAEYKFAIGFGRGGLRAEQVARRDYHWIKSFLTRPTQGDDRCFLTAA